MPTDRAIRNDLTVKRYINCVFSFIHLGVGTARPLGERRQVCSQVDVGTTRGEGVLSGDGRVFSIPPWENSLAKALR